MDAVGVRGPRPGGQVIRDPKWFGRFAEEWPTSAAFAFWTVAAVAIGVAVYLFGAAK